MGYGRRWWNAWGFEFHDKLSVWPGWGTVVTGGMHGDLSPMISFLSGQDGVRSSLVECMGI